MMLQTWLDTEIACGFYYLTYLIILLFLKHEKDKLYTFRGTRWYSRKNNFKGEMRVYDYHKNKN